MLILLSEILIISMNMLSHKRLWFIQFNIISIKNVLRYDKLSITFRKLSLSRLRNIIRPHAKRINGPQVQGGLNKRTQQTQSPLSGTLSQRRKI